MDLGLQGKACLVTGSTGGIGLETARVFVAEGARVATCGRSEAPRIGEVLHVRADLSEPEAPSPGERGSALGASESQCSQPQTPR